MKVIGIAGRAGAGKNTVGGLLAAVLTDQGYSVALDSFAGAIKQELREQFGWPGVKDAFWRKALQVRGAWARAKNREYWIQVIEDRWRAVIGVPAPDAPDFLILTDVRYRNEAEWCTKRGVVWLVEGRGGLEGDAGEHASELELLEGWTFRTVIQNRRTLGDLVMTVENIVRDEGLHLPAPAEKDKTS